MGSEWREIGLNDLGEVARGRSRHRPRYAEHLYGGTYPFIQTGDVKASGGIIDSHSQTYSEAGLAQSRLWPANTMCITIAANIAETGILSYPACFPDSVIGFIANENNCDVRFIEYRFRYLKAQLQREAIGSVQDNINLATFERLKFSIPKVPEQKRIAHILGSLDSKIQLNRQTNQTLEQMAQALFKSWFVDFDPVIDNALAAGNPIPPELEQKAQVRAAAQASQAKPGAHPHDHASELPQHLRELFPSEFEHTEALGWVPKGWGVGSLSDIADYEKEKTNTAELNLENYVSTENMNKEKSGISTAAKLASTDQVPIFSVGQTLISNIRPYFKKIWFASFNGGRSNDVLCFQAKYKDVNEYLYSLLYQDTFFEYMTVTSKGTKMPRGDKKAIMDWPVVLPTLNLMEEFSKIIKPSFLANQLRITESSTLIQMRDTLLPKLISGELRLPVAETDAPSLTDEASV